MSLDSLRQGPAEPERPAAEPARAERTAQSPLFRIGRVLFGGILSFMALDNLRNLEERIGYAESKGAPAPDVSVPTASVGLLAGGIGVALWRYPAAAAAGVAWFFLSVTPVMHDFWTEEDPEQKQQQMTHFLKNSALLGAALAFLSFGRRRE